MAIKVSPPFYDFSVLEPVTMTVIVYCDIVSMNLPALFSFLPITTENIPDHEISTKQGKIKLPSRLNVPGKILSMRYGNDVRGIVRSLKSNGFPNSITIDIGTSERIISTKLSQTLSFVGVKSVDLAIESANTILAAMRQCKDDLSFLQSNRSIAQALKDLYLTGEPAPTGQIERRVWDIFESYIAGKPADQHAAFLEYLLQNHSLFNGSLAIRSHECVMANIPFNLGYSINLLEFVSVMNYPPFECKFNNFRTASTVRVRYYYRKRNAITDKEKMSRLTIEVYRSGYVRLSGPDNDLMHTVYNEFMRRLTPNYDRVVSRALSERTICVPSTARPRVLSGDEWVTFLRGQRDKLGALYGAHTPVPLVPTVTTGALVLENDAYTFRSSRDRAVSRREPPEPDHGGHDRMCRQRFKDDW